MPEGIRTESNPINQNILSKLFSFVQLFVDIGRYSLFILRTRRISVNRSGARNVNKISKVN